MLLRHQARGTCVERNLPLMRVVALSRTRPDTLMSDTSTTSSDMQPHSRNAPRVRRRPLLWALVSSRPGVGLRSQQWLVHPAWSPEERVCLWLLAMPAGGGGTRIRRRTEKSAPAYPSCVSRARLTSSGRLPLRRTSCGTPILRPLQSGMGQLLRPNRFIAKSDKYTTHREVDGLQPLRFIAIALAPIVE
jgi:hypothetical protein